MISIRSRRSSGGKAAEAPSVESVSLDYWVTGNEIRESSKEMQEEEEEKDIQVPEGAALDH